MFAVVRKTMIVLIGVAMPHVLPSEQVALAAPAHHRNTVRGAICKVNGRYPDLACTPGAAMRITVDEICSTGTKSRRGVSSATKRNVYESYGFSYPQPAGMFEVDHFSPLELGGSNDVSNLWPEAANPVPGFHQ